MRELGMKHTLQRPRPLLDNDDDLAELASRGGHLETEESGTDDENGRRSVQTIARFKRIVERP
jgi:hypothetical protein